MLHAFVPEAKRKTDGAEMLSSIKADDWNDYEIVAKANHLTQKINGKVTDQQDVPVPDFTVLAFSTDPALWRAQSRQIMTTRPDQTGQYRFRGLPPGDYYIATIDPAEPGEWFEPAYLDAHRVGAARVTLSEGDVKTKDFKISLR